MCRTGCNPGPGLGTCGVTHDENPSLLPTDTHLNKVENTFSSSHCLLFHNIVLYFFPVSVENNWRQDFIKNIDHTNTESDPRFLSEQHQFLMASIHQDVRNSPLRFWSLLTHICCRFVSSTFMLRISRSITFQRCSTRLIVMLMDQFETTFAL